MKKKVGVFVEKDLPILVKVFCCVDRSCANNICIFFGRLFVFSIFSIHVCWLCACFFSESYLEVGTYSLANPSPQQVSGTSRVGKTFVHMVGTKCRIYHRMLDIMWYLMLSTIDATIIQRIS